MTVLFLRLRCGVLWPGKYVREVVKEGYTPLVFRSFGGMRKTCPWNAPALAPNCPPFNAELAHRFGFFLVGHGVGANGPAAKKGAQ